MSASIFMTTAGAVSSYTGNMNAAKAAQQGAEFQAAQLDQNAGQAQAVAQRNAIDDRRKAQFAQSRALALAAASGAGASDPGVMDIVGNIAKEGAYRGLLDLYEGEDQARQMKLQAASARYTGEAQATAYKTQAMGSLLKGGSSLFMKYAGNTTAVNPAAGALDPMFKSWANDPPYG